MQRPDRPTTRGFTILEMLIAMTITVIMLGVISRIFFETTKAISQGTALSQIIANTRAVSDQLDRDAQQLVGADEGGFIVIVNKIILDVPMKTREGGETNRPVRADQLVFIRETNGMEHIAPQGKNSFAPAGPVDLDAPFARVWYGHVRRTLLDGTDGINPNNLRLGVDLTENPNRVGTNWILGRQALMLRETNGGINIRANNARYDSTVNGLSGILPPQQLYMGLTDVCDQSLVDINTDLAAAANQAEYQNRAYNYMFINQRLRANLFPKGTTFDSWQIGQMHPVFMENVSDFVVEFAADTDNDGQIDINLATGNVEWYGLGHAPGQTIPPTPPVPAWSGYDLLRNPNDPVIPPVNGTEIRFVFRHDYGDNWPYMIRIRYRLHDSNGRFEEYIGDSNLDTVKKLLGHGTKSGQWFEQIFRVR